MADERARQLRTNRTKAERRLWRKLRELKDVGFKFRQQVPIDYFIVDFACFSKRLITEVDGGTHSTHQEQAKDARCERYLRGQGFRILRFWDLDVTHNIEGVMDTIAGALGPPPPSPPRKGEGRSPWRAVVRSRIDSPETPIPDRCSRARRRK